MTLRIGIIGAGKNTCKRHIPGFQALPGVEVAGVVNRSIASSQEVASRFGIPKVYGHPDELLEDPTLDAVCIGTWPYLHADFTVQALEHGKHVLVEARMAANEPQAKSMLNASQAHPQLTAMIVPAPDSLSYDSLLTSLVQERLGKLLFVDLTSYTGAFPVENTPVSWRQLREYSGDNILFNGIYYEMLMRWLGPLVKVRAEGRLVKSKGPHWQTGAEVQADVPDLLNISGVWKKDQALFQARISSVCGGPEREECAIFGENGSLFLDILGNSLSFHENGKSISERMPIGGLDGWNVERDFVRSIETGQAVERTNFSDGMAYMQYVSKVRRSLETGNWELLG